MISVDIDSEDIGALVQSLQSIAGVSALQKISGCRLEKDLLAFEQSFVVGVTTTVRVKLSCDKSGNLLIRIMSLADNKTGNNLIQSTIKGYSLFSRGKGGIAGIIEIKTGGRLVRKSDDVLSFNPFPLKFQSVSIRGGRLSVQLCFPEKQAKNPAGIYLYIPQS